MPSSFARDLRSRRTEPGRAAFFRAFPSELPRSQARRGGRSADKSPTPAAGMYERPRVIGRSERRALTVERVTDPARLPTMASAWDELIDEGDPGSVFRSSAWLLPWWRWFSAGKQPCVYVATAGTRLVGVLPAYHAKSPVGSRRLRLLGDGIVTSDYLGVIARPGECQLASEAIAESIVTTERDVLLEGLTATEPFVSSLRAGARETGSLVAARRDACPYVEIGRERDFEAWLRGRPRGSHLRRRRRWLERRAGFRIEIVTAEAEISAALATLWRLHRARWAREGGTKAVPSVEAEQFHYESAQNLARRGWARLYVLHADGAPRAALYGFERNGRFSYYQSGSDPSWDARSVGTVVLGAALEDAFERGLEEFDFLRGTEPYKLLYASSQRSLVTLRIANGPLASSLLLAEQGNRIGRSLTRKAVSYASRRGLGEAVRSATSRETTR